MEKILRLNDECSRKFLRSDAGSYLNRFYVRSRFHLARLRCSLYLTGRAGQRGEDSMVIFSSERQIVWMGACIGSVRQKALTVTRLFWNPFHLNVRDIIAYDVDGSGQMQRLKVAPGFAASPDMTAFGD